MFFEVWFKLNLTFSAAVITGYFDDEMELQIEPESQPLNLLDSLDLIKMVHADPQYKIIDVRLEKNKNV